MSSSARFWDKIALKYSKQPVRDEAAYRRKLEVTRDYLRRDMQVFEFGCGTGSTAIVHAPHVAHIHAIDISGKMIEIARRKAAAANADNVSFEVATIEDHDAPDGSCDAVMGHSILHLLEDKDAAIAKVGKLLKPGGIFVSSTFCGGDSHRWLRFVLPIGQFFGKLPYVDLFTRAALTESIARAGFTIEHEWQPGKGKAVFIVAKKT
jgi:ubiquinone/menaquinone biosynthesis C-methylase UbiE